MPTAKEYLDVARAETHFGSNDGACFGAGDTGQLRPRTLPPDFPPQTELKGVVRVIDTTPEVFDAQTTTNKR
jgi:hypothetical protein